MWRQTSFLGLGRATKSKKNLLCTYIVARYSPPSTKDNIKDNVPKGRFSEMQFCGKRCDVPDNNGSGDQGDYMFFLLGDAIFISRLTN